MMILINQAVVPHISGSILREDALFQPRRVCCQRYSHTPLGEIQCVTSALTPWSFPPNVLLKTHLSYLSPLWQSHIFPR